MTTTTRKRTKPKADTGDSTERFAAAVVAVAAETGGPVGEWLRELVEGDRAERRERNMGPRGATRGREK